MFRDRLGALGRVPLDGFLLAMFATVGLASLWPATGTGAQIFGWATKSAVALLFFLYGARLPIEDVWAGLRSWKLHLLVLGTTFVVFPVLGLALSPLVPWGVSAALYTGLLFTTLLPSTVQSSIAFTSIARGNVPAAMVSASVSNMLGVVLTPALALLLMGGAAGVGLRVGLGPVLDITAQLLVPFLVGQLLHRWLGGWLRAHRTPTRLVERGSILLVVYTAFSAGMAERIWSRLSLGEISMVLVISAVLLAVVLLVTWQLGRLAGLDRADRIVLVFCGSKKSLASGLPMASVLFAGGSVGFVVLPMMIFHQLQLVVCAVLARRWEADSAPTATVTPVSTPS